MPNQKKNSLSDIANTLQIEEKDLKAAIKKFDYFEPSRKIVRNNRQQGKFLDILVNMQREAENGTDMSAPLADLYQLAATLMSDDFKDTLENCEHLAPFCK